MIVYLGGDRWERVAGTDKRVVQALAESGEVLWVDPPYPLGMPGRPDRLARMGPRLSRLVPLGPPFASRKGVRSVVQRCTAAAVRRALHASGAVVEATVVASARGAFPDGLEGERVLYVTDDWVAGAELMGMDRSWVERRLQRNLAIATKVCAVSPGLVERMASLGQKPVELLPNGCEPAPSALRPNDTAPGAVAALVGQLNERLDFGALDAVADRGLAVHVIGPRTERDPAAGRRLDSFLSRDNVTWLGEVDDTEIPRLLTQCSVGLTPYALSEFNRASFPLKTLEYIANGLPVVSTDIPASRWLGSDAITIADGPEQFADQVARVAATASSSREGIARRIAFARSHSWTRRAARLREIIATG